MTSSIKQISELTPKEYLTLQEEFKKHLKLSRQTKQYKINYKIWKQKNKHNKLLF